MALQLNAAKACDKVENFTTRWSCLICLDVPIASALSPLCGHVFCLACALKLKNKVPEAPTPRRQCPACEGEQGCIYVSVLQPTVLEDIEQLASVLFPSTWGLWELLKALPGTHELHVFNSAARFVLLASPAELVALRILRLSARLMETTKGLAASTHAVFVLEPLVAAESGKAWRGQCWPGQSQCDQLRSLKTILVDFDPQACNGIM